MEKIINIDGRQVKLISNGALPLRYKMQFNRDAFQDIVKLTKVKVEGEETLDISQLDLEVFYNFVWVLAKTGDPSIPPLLDWLEAFDNFPIIEIIPEIMDMITSNLQTSKKK